MNFSLPNPPGQAPEPPQAVRDLPPRQRPAKRRGLRKAPLIVGAMAVAAGGVALTTVPGLGGSLGLDKLFASPYSKVITYKIEKRDLPVTVLTTGALESSNNTDVQCEVEGQTTILMIKPEGSRVEEGELVCELDSAGLRDELVNQEITTKQREADLEQAKKTLEVAEIAVTEYIEGTFPEQEQNALGSIALAQSELAQADERLKWSNRMLEIGYVTTQQNYSDKLQLQKSQFSLQEATTKLMVLRNFTKEKQVKELQASVEKARSDMLAKQSAYELEKTKEQKLRQQIDKCKIYAPSNGLIVYANEQNRFGGSNQQIIEEGATVRERQRIFSLPDLDRMRVNTKVHESMVDRVTPGLKTRIRVDAFSNRPLVGTVTLVNPLPDPTSFFSSDIKVYTTMVAIDNGFSELRPGMTAQVEILVTQLDNVLSVPVQAVLEFKGKNYAYVRQGDEFARREITLGINNDKLVEVKEGINDGDEVALNPLALMSEAEKRDAFSVASKGAGGKSEWSSDAVAAGRSPGELGPDGKPAAGGAAEKKARGGAGMPAFLQKLQNLSEEDRSKLRDPGTSEAEKADLMRKAGVTDAEIQQMEQMRSQFQGGGGPPGGGEGRGGRGGRGGPGGGGPGGGAQ